MLLEVFDLGRKPIEDPEEFRRGGLSQVQSQGLAGVVAKELFVSCHNRLGVSQKDTWGSYSTVMLIRR